MNPATCVLSTEGGSEKKFAAAFRLRYTPETKTKKDRARQSAQSARIGRTSVARAPVGRVAAKLKKNAAIKPRAIPRLSVPEPPDVRKSTP